jgi:hypothetical protein
MEVLRRIFGNIREEFTSQQRLSHSEELSRYVRHIISLEKYNEGLRDGLDMWHERYMYWKHIVTI